MKLADRLYMALVALWLPIAVVIAVVVTLAQFVWRKVIGSLKQPLAIRRGGSAEGAI